MCGLFGFQFSTLPSRETTRVLSSILACHMQERGHDAWGFSADGNIHRGIGNISMSEPLRRIGGVRQLMAHTRAGTTGKNVVANAHPFEFGNIIGAHNGIISNYAKLNREYERSFEVDSMHIFAHMDEGEKLTELSGWGAVSWYEKDHPDTLYLAQDWGDLCIADAINERGKRIGIVYASTYHALLQACQLAGLECVCYAVRATEVYALHNGTLTRCEDRSFKLGSLAGTFQSSGTSHEWMPKRNHKRGKHTWKNGQRAYTDVSWKPSIEKDSGDPELDAMRDYYEKLEAGEEPNYEEWLESGRPRSSCTICTDEWCDCSTQYGCVCDCCLDQISLVEYWTNNPDELKVTPDDKRCPDSFVGQSSGIRYQCRKEAGHLGTDPLVIKEPHAWVEMPQLALPCGFNPNPDDAA